MPAPKEVIDLVERFDQHLDAYRNGSYKEAQLRQEFLDPFFKALGWDMDNTQGYAEAYKEVIHEDAVKIGDFIKAPDYSFRIGGTRKFFVEAKKPSVYIKGEPEPAFQLRRYAWSGKLPLSILTDFEEFAVYDCRIQPAKTDKADKARINYWTYEDYADKWDEIAAIFSREAVLKGSFDKYATTAKGKKGTAAVDAVFLDEIESWRETLAKNIALRNPDLSQKALNFAVQQTIDRTIFLRICEDRGIEPYGQLQALQNGANVYKRLAEYFRKADERYNSGLFHFHKEQDRAEEPDRLTLGLDIDDKPLKEIFQSLYYPDSPYEFSVLGADILGSVYEQFLGKVIRLTEGHHAKIEEKPEVKKAGGVYYTPTYIVGYIVKHTVGKLLESKTPKQVEKLRILDPACGSGSFLIGAYQYLLDWHLDWYEKDGAEKHAKGKLPKLWQGKGGVWRLTTGERKRILTNNIYGVDIDSQAVEVTKLSLLLKVLEGESDQTLQTQLFHERVLPDLGRNIKCGNSLIGPEFYETQLIPLGDDEGRRINAFDWQKEFSEIIQAGGFDVVISNPPYIRIQVMQEWAPLEVEYYKQRYTSAAKGNYDIYVVFVERGLSLLKKGMGQLGFILPSKFFATDYGEPLRELICDNKALSEVVDFGHAQVFDRATTYTCLLFLTGEETESISYLKVTNPPQLASDGMQARMISVGLLSEAPWIFSTNAESGLADKLLRRSVPLGDLPARIGRGSSSGADDVFILQQKGNKLYARSGAEISVEPEILRVPVYATDFRGYVFSPRAEERIIFPYDVIADSYALKAENEMRLHFPKAYKYLLSRRKELENRKQYKAWYGFSAPRNLDVHDSADMLVPLLADKGLYCRLPDDASRYCLMASGGFSITIGRNSGLSPTYVLGLLNSRLLFWRLRSISNVFRGGWITCTKQYVETLPIYTINSDDSAGIARHDRIVALVQQMLTLNTQLTAATTPHEQENLKRQIDATDRQIDKLVYELYGLTNEEIKIIEGK